MFIVPFYYLLLLLMEKKQKIENIIKWLQDQEYWRWSICSQDWKYKVLYIVLSLFTLKNFIQENDLNFTWWSFTDSLDGLIPKWDEVLFTCDIE